MFADFMTDTVSIRRATGRTKSATGFIKEQWTTVHEGVKCSIQSESGEQRQHQTGEVTIQRFSGYFGWWIDVRINDEVVVADGTTFLVVDTATIENHHIETTLVTRKPRAAAQI